MHIFVLSSKEKQKQFKINVDTCQKVRAVMNYTFISIRIRHNLCWVHVTETWSTYVRTAAVKVYTFPLPQIHKTHHMLQIKTCNTRCVLFIELLFTFGMVSFKKIWDCLCKSFSSSSLYVPLLDTGFLSQWENLSFNSHQGLVQIKNFTPIILLCLRVQVSLSCF